MIAISLSLKRWPNGGGLCLAKNGAGKPRCMNIPVRPLHPPMRGRWKSSVKHLPFGRPDAALVCGHRHSDASAFYPCLDQIDLVLDLNSCWAPTAAVVAQCSARRQGARQDVRTTGGGL